MPVYMYHMPVNINLSLGMKDANCCLMNFYINTTNSKSFEKYIKLRQLMPKLILISGHSSKLFRSSGNATADEEEHGAGDCSNVHLLGSDVC